MYAYSNWHSIRSTPPIISYCILYKCRPNANIQALFEHAEWEKCMEKKLLKRLTCKFAYATRMQTHNQVLVNVSTSNIMLLSAQCSLYCVIAHRCCHYQYIMTNNGTWGCFIHFLRTIQSHVDFTNGKPYLDMMNASRVKKLFNAICAVKQCYVAQCGCGWCELRLLSICFCVLYNHGCGFLHIILFNSGPRWTMSDISSIIY